MIDYLCISIFRKSITDLLKVKRGVYSGVEKEIKSDFKNRNLNEILINGDKILVETERIVIKLRLPDKRAHLSKSDGYRLIYCVYKTKEQVIFLEIYPKNGPLQKIDLSDTEYIQLMKCLEQEIKNGSLQPYPIEEK